MFRRIAAPWLCLVIIFSSFIVFIEITPNTSAKTIYVDDSGGADYTKIQDAINASNNGDIVYVYKGTYYENIVVNKSIELVGEDMNGSIIDGKGSGDTVVVTVDWVSITNISITNCGSGDYDAGLEIYSNNNNIFNNNISFNLKTGIYLDEADYNVISNNMIYSNDASGIYLYWSNENDIENNYISGNNVGIGFWYSKRNSITGNSIVANGVGLSKGSSSIDNEVYHNNFIENTDQAWDSGNEDWDNGIEGNYWDDYNGIDDDEDGIGDTPYSIDDDSKDNYPLMYLYPDFYPPVINLNSPGNNSISKAGTIIDILISDSNLKKVEYSVDDMGYSTFNEPYDIYTNTWKDKTYIIKVRASDISGKKSTREYIFTIDSTKPSIALNSLQDKAFIKSGTLIDFDISDLHLKNSNYSINGGDLQILNSPFDISTSDWQDGTYNIEIYTEDYAGNTNGKLFTLNIDSIIPSLNLTSPTNNSLIKPGTMITFDISDTNLDEILYSINKGHEDTLNPPYEIDTLSWSDGVYYLEISVKDFARNERIESFIFTIDGTPPEIESTYPTSGNDNIPIDALINITFSESMNITSVGYALIISPSIAYSLSWRNNSKILTINFIEPLAHNTQYLISINSVAKDIVGHELKSGYEFDFTTEPKPMDKGEEGLPLVYILLSLIMAIIVALLIVFMALAKKRKSSTEMVAPEIESPAPMQVTCPSCNNLLQVNDIGTTMNVTCPFCSTLLTVQSQKTPAQKPEPQMQPQPVAQPEIQPQQPMMQISCPKCLHKFSVAKTEGPIKVQCPNCGISGSLG